MLVIYFCECHFSGRATPLLYGACSFNIIEHISEDHQVEVQMWADELLPDEQSREYCHIYSNTTNHITLNNY